LSTTPGSGGSAAAIAALERRAARLAAVITAAWAVRLKITISLLRLTRRSYVAALKNVVAF
jgi:hypothetical protein